MLLPDTLGFERSVANGLRLHVLPTDRFKTYALSLYIGAPLEEQTVTSTALVPFVLRRGTQTLPETRSFRRKLDELYGAGFGFDIYKRGDNQIIHFRLDMIEDRFVAGNGQMLREAISFLGDCLTNPFLMKGTFFDKYVQEEKETLRKRLEAIINDKMRYAAERCIAEMCKNEPYRLHQLGRIEDLNAISAQSLYERYQEWVASSPIDLYVVGNTTLEEVQEIVQRSFRLPQTRNQMADYRRTAVDVPVREVNRVTERLDVTQGKLNMGLRTYTTYGDEDYAAALVYNGILGGYAHSKLFINVREKASLAYYVWSRLDGHKGIMTIQSGINMDHYDKTNAIIQEQLEAMRAGSIEQLEYDQTIAMLRNQLTEIQDSAFEMIAFDFNNRLSGKERSTNGLIREIEGVGLEDIRRIANKVKLDTIYFLTGRKGE